jgi:phosphatidylinositol 3-kinase
MVSELGPCSELLTSRVPLPLNPHLLLEGLVPEECTCFRSAMLPVKLSYRLNPKAIDWTTAQPLMPPPLSSSSSISPSLIAQPSSLITQPSSSSSSSSSAAAAGHVMHQGGLAGQRSMEPGGLGVTGGVTGEKGTLGSSGSGAAGDHRPSAVAMLEALPTKTGVVVQGDQLRCVMIYKKGDDLRQV